MKKIILLISVLFSIYSNAQIANYHPLLESVNRWSFVKNYFPVAPRSATALCSYPFWEDVLYTVQDTTINNITYKILLEDYYPFSGPCIFGFLREDTGLQKTYFKDVYGNPEDLIYDFSMQIGDSIPLFFVLNGPGRYFDNGYYILDSISNFTIQQGVRKAFHLNCHSCINGNTLTWIEGVGNLGNIIYTYSENSDTWGPFMFNCPGFPHNQGIFMSCFQHSQRVYHDSCAYAYALSDACYAIIDSCNYGNTCGSVSEFESGYSPVHIIPDPIHSNASVILDDLMFLNSTLNIFDGTGKLVRKIKINSETTLIDRQGLINGLYFYQIVNDKGNSANGKIIVE